MSENNYKPLLKEVYSDKPKKKDRNKQLLSKLLKRVRNKKIQYAK